ncbi:MAG: divalent-cation tolerance protein CutA [Gammaproteobacteria bacterium]
MSYHIVFCTCPDADTAGMIADALIDRRLAACVTILPGVRSVYRWQDKRESSDEWLLIIKSAVAVYAQLQAGILTLHPYEVPEIIAVPITMGLPAYLAWIGRETDGR